MLQQLSDNHLGDNLTLHLDGKSVVVDSLPSGGQFGRVMITVKDASDGDVFQETWPRTGKIRFEPGFVRPGEYRLRLFAGPASDGYYHSWFGMSDGFRLQFDGKAAAFLEAPCTVVNRRFLRNLPVSGSFLSECLAPTRDIQSDAPAIKALAAELRRGRCFSEAIMVGVNDWVARNISYDLDLLEGDRYLDADMSAVRVLQARRSVCSGYHHLVSALLRANGIPTLGICCYSLGFGTRGGWNNWANLTGNTNHIITAALIGQRWRVMDVTWNSNQQYRRGKVTSRGVLGASRAYCDATIPFISLSHRFDDYEL